MKTLILCLCLLCLAASAEANYKLWTQPEIIPHTVLRDYGDGWVAVPNPEGYLPMPSGIVYKPITWTAYVPEPEKRTLIYETTAPGNTDAEIFAACPGFREYRETVVRYDAQREIDKLDTLYMAGDKSSWAQIRDEVTRWGSDGIQTTPFSDKVALAAGMSREEYLLGMKAKIGPYEDSMSAILGQRIALIRTIYEAQTVGDLLAVRWPQSQMSAQGLWNVVAP